MEEVPHIGLVVRPQPGTEISDLASKLALHLEADNTQHNPAYHRAHGTVSFVVALLPPETVDPFVYVFARRLAQLMEEDDTQHNPAYYHVRPGGLLYEACFDLLELRDYLEPNYPGWHGTSSKKRAYDVAKRAMSQLLEWRVDTGPLIAFCKDCCKLRGRCECPGKLLRSGEKAGRCGPRLYHDQPHRWWILKASLVACSTEQLDSLTEAVRRDVISYREHLGPPRPLYET